MPRMTQAELNAYNARRTAIRDSGAVGDCTDESELHQQIFDECRRRGWIALHGAMSERTSRTLGEPDFCVVADGGRVFFIEAKSATGKLRPEQAQMIAWLQKLKAQVAVVRSIQEFIQFVS